MSGKRKETKSEPKIEGVEYLDESEQKAIMKRITDDNNRQNRSSRMAFAALALIFGLVKLYFGASQYLYPWQIQPHSTFIGEIHENDVSIWETISGFSFLACAFYINPFSTDVATKSSAWYAALVSVITLGALWVMTKGFVWSMTFVWFLGGNIIFVLIVTYVEYIIRSSEEEVKGLYGLAYNYKKV